MKDDPFSGIKLSEQAGLDQQLFSRGPIDQNDTKTRERGKEGGRETEKEASKPGKKKRRKEEGRETEKEPDREAGREGVFPSGSPTLALDTTELPVHKVSYLATESEWNLFDEMKLDLRRRHGLKTTKNDIARLAIRFLARDYEQKQGDSFLVKKLRKK